MKSLWNMWLALLDYPNKRNEPTWKRALAATTVISIAAVIVFALVALVLVAMAWNPLVTCIAGFPVLTFVIMYGILAMS